MGRKRIDTLLETPEATIEFAEKFAQTLSPDAIIALHGDLGAGKTTFMQGFVKALGNHPILVQSPTFVYLHAYPTTIPVFHFDLYRLRGADDFIALGFIEYFDQGGITAIEWPERILELLPERTQHLYLFHTSPTSRRLVIE